MRRSERTKTRSKISTRSSKNKWSYRREFLKSIRIGEIAVMMKNTRKRRRMILRDLERKRAHQARLRELPL
jgi:predicted metal-dependent RNase